MLVQQHNYNADDSSNDEAMDEQIMPASEINVSSEVDSYFCQCLKCKISSNLIYSNPNSLTLAVLLGDQET